MPKRKQQKPTREKHLKTETEREDLDEIAKKAQAKYSEETCPICHSRYDENGLCACGAGGN